jgi:hypothetical protein
MITGEHLCPRALAQNLASQETRSRAGSDQPNKIAHCFLQHKPAPGPGDIDYLDEAGFSVTGLHLEAEPNGAKDRSILGCTILAQMLPNRGSLHKNGHLTLM